jgi:hypothetical protein
MHKALAWGGCGEGEAQAVGFALADELIGAKTMQQVSREA